MGGQIEAEATQLSIQDRMRSAFLNTVAGRVKEQAVMDVRRTAFFAGPTAQAAIQMTKQGSVGSKITMLKALHQCNAATR